MATPLAFLSYTRPDDEFFGGYITAFRRLLENAMHVVSGDRSFRVFQDVDGLVIGENWQKRLAEVIDASSFFVPMLTPLFFSSPPCRSELEQFLQHERDLQRDDLILPVYFQVSAKLEKPEETAKDPLASEIARRQRFDWREQADVPLDNPSTRRALLNLAQAVVQAQERLAGPAPSPGSVPMPAPLSPPRPAPDVTGSGGLAGAAAGGLVVRTPAPVAARVVNDADPRLGLGVAAGLRRGALAPLPVLWVDDHPDNNRWERRALEAYGIRFTLALDTEHALQAWKAQGPFAAVVSDMGRAGDPAAGFTLLAALRGGGVAAPYFVYTSPALAQTLAGEAARRGALGITADPDTLVAQVLGAIRGGAQSVAG